MGKTKISLKELASIKRKFTKPIDDYLNRFQLLKAMCFTQEEKARENKNKRVAYIDFSNDDEGSYNGPLDLDKNEIDLVELKQGPHYAYKVLASSNGKNPIEPENNNKFPKKTYAFDVTKCDEIFDLLVKDAKVPPLEQRKKKGFSKYHSFLGHKTSQCFLFRDLVQNAIQEGRLKFGDKPRSQMKIDSNPLQMDDAHYTEAEEVNMVEVTDDFKMIEVTKDFVNEPVMVRVSEHLDQGFFNDFFQEVVGNVTNGNNDVFDTRVTKDSNLMIVTKETVDGFV
ncbi:uncharacterized protein LOC127123289 [Lathyrus oleraceus]|uniref:uncharacterized protein LOC127123289 n=1 Tax=Pisum sativum TaxID=3888 RepID=UPI0021D0B38D|nr:uncharacterized protein LOC127123289 [Pisum sativum]